MDVDTNLDPQHAPVSYNPADYERPSVTADVALFACRHGRLEVLLVQRRSWPYADHWALPGGFVEMDETLEAAARRELHEETGLGDVWLEQLHAFGDPNRDPRMRVITVAYLGLLAAGQASAVEAGDDAAAASWWPVDALPPLAFDHGQILAVARERLRWKLEYTSLGGLLLPETFTFGELHDLYETLLREKIDARTLRRKLLAAGALEETGQRAQTGDSRPAHLYRFTHVPKPTAS